MRDSTKQFAHYLTIALESASKTESHIDLGMRIGALGTNDALQLLDEIGQLQRMLSVPRQRVLDGGK